MLSLISWPTMKCYLMTLLRCITLVRILIIWLFYAARMKTLIYRFYHLWEEGHRLSLLHQWNKVSCWDLHLQGFHDCLEITMWLMSHWTLCWQQHGFYSQLGVQQCTKSLGSVHTMVQFRSLVHFLSSRKKVKKSKYFITISDVNASNGWKDEEAAA